jgi:hypothetical protein
VTGVQTCALPIWLDSGTLRPLFAHITAPAAAPYVLMPHGGHEAGSAFARWLQAHCAAASARAAEWLSGLG